MVNKTTHLRRRKECGVSATTIEGYSKARPQSKHRKLFNFRPRCHVASFTFSGLAVHISYDLMVQSVGSFCKIDTKSDQIWLSDDFQVSKRSQFNKIWQYNYSIRAFWIKDWLQHPRRYAPPWLLRFHIPTLSCGTTVD